MENLVLWGIPVLGGLIGLSTRLYRSYTSLLNFGFAIYLALWTENLVSGLYRLPGSANSYKAAVTMLFCAILFWVLLLKLTEQLMPEEKAFEFPALLDKLGGALCGFLTGMVLINFAAFLLCTTPQKTAAGAFVSLPALESSSVRTLVSFSRTVDRLSFQGYSRSQRFGKLEELVRKADPPKEEQPPAVP